MIYSFIDTLMCLTHLTRLSKKEKERLLDSYFVRKGRKYNFTITKKELGITNTKPGDDYRFLYSDKNTHLVLSLIERLHLRFQTQGDASDSEERYDEVSD